MKLTAVIKLLPTEGQRILLFETLQTANAACNAISDVAWQNQSFGRAAVHQATYYPVRARFKVASQLAIRCIGKVVDAYETERSVKHQFRKLGAIPYDCRILNYRMETDDVSIWLMGGRQEIPFVMGDRQRHLLQFQQGQSDLVYKRGKFFLYATCEVPDDAAIKPDGFLGVDLGIVNIATDSQGTTYSGAHMQNARYRYRRLRAKLQRKGTLGAKRRLRKLSGREARFRHHLNHTISKQLVAKAKGTGRGIALENLEGIRDRVTVQRQQRATLHSWSFHDLREKIAYKAQLAGVPVVAVDPRNTSRTCPVCGCVDKRNRPQQSTFSCIQCGFAAHADYVAAINIGDRAVVNQPDCSDADTSAAPEQSSGL